MENNWYALGQGIDKLPILSSLNEILCVFLSEGNKDYLATFKINGT